MPSLYLYSNEIFGLWCSLANGETKSHFKHSFFLSCLHAWLLYGFCCSIEAKKKSHGLQNRITIRLQILLLFKNSPQNTPQEITSTQFSAKAFCLLMFNLVRKRMDIGIYCTIFKGRCMEVIQYPPLQLVISFKVCYMNEKSSLLDIYMNTSWS